MPIKYKKDKKLHKLKYWRGILQLTQDDMGLLLGYSGANYCQKENGLVEIGLREMLLIQKEFNKKLVKMGQSILSLDDIFLS